MSSLTPGFNPTLHHSTPNEIGPSINEILPQEPNEIGPSINEVLPLDMIRLVLGNIPIFSERSVSLVCKSWAEMVPKLPDYTLNIFGQEAWEGLGLKVEGDIPQLPENILQQTRKLRRKLSGEKEAPRCSVILMPKGMTLNKLKELMESKGIKFRYISRSILTQLGDAPIDKSYWYLITNDVIEGSKNQLCATPF